MSNSISDLFIDFVLVVVSDFTFLNKVRLIQVEIQLFIVLSIISNFVI